MKGEERAVIQVRNGYVLCSGVGVFFSDCERVFVLYFITEAQ